MINGSRYFNLSVNENRKRYKSLEKLNTSFLIRNKQSLNYKDNNRRKALYTQRSVDNLKAKTKRTLGNFSTLDYVLNKNYIWEKYRLQVNSKVNSNNTSANRSLNSISVFSQTDKKCSKIPKKNKKTTSNNYYSKFINKKLLTEQNKNNKNKNKDTTQNNDKKNNRNKIVPLKEQTVIIKKINQDDKLIDTNVLKKKFSENGINLISIKGTSNSLVPIKNDSVKIVLNSKDFYSSKFNKMEKFINFSTFI